ncbi:MAG: redoxin domain-containing protein [Cytophagales bacterium]|nr:redoxin domain-containing protein [Cytophagales bacterium]
MMLDDSILILILGFLTVVVAFNLWLNFRIIRAIRLLPISKPTPQNLEAGTLIPNFPLEGRFDKSTVDLSQYAAYAKVFVFLASKCSKCKTKLPEIQNSLDRAVEQGVMLRILTLESKGRMKTFLEDKALFDVTVTTDQTTYDFLNPQGTSPYYLFIDAENILQAEGFIGDENWSNFMEQLSPSN